MAQKTPQSRVTPSWRFLRQHPAYLLAFGLGSGLAKWAPGTVGSLVAVLLYLFLQVFLSPAAVMVIAVAMFFVGVWAVEKTTAALNVPDYGGIVIDEIVAMWMVLAAVPQTGLAIAVAFALFRFFDIVKPWPIRWVDRTVSGGLGVMLDDVIAALFALGVSMCLHRCYLF